jgi:hypothetical protein
MPFHCQGRKLWPSPYLLTSTSVLRRAFSNTHWLDLRTPQSSGRCNHLSQLMKDKEQASPTPSVSLVNRFICIAVRNLRITSALGDGRATHDANRIFPVASRGWIAASLGAPLLDLQGDSRWQDEKPGVFSSQAYAGRTRTYYWGQDGSMAMRSILA